MEKKEHPRAQVLRWVADGEQIEARFATDGYDGAWKLESPNTVLSISNCGGAEWQFRIKPTPMCELVGIKFPVPMREAPKCGETIWIAAAEGAFHIDWHGLGTDQAYLSAGLCHTTEEAAQQHSEALRAVNLAALEGAK